MPISLNTGAKQIQQRVCFAPVFYRLNGVISSADSYRDQTAATGAVMKEVWGYDLNKYGSFMLHTGLLLTAALPLSAGLTAADIGFGVVFLALYMLEMHILMCLALHGTPCFDSEGLLMLGSEAVGAAAEGIDAQADSEVCQNYLLGVQLNGAKTMAGLYGGKDPCGLEPEKEKEEEPEKCDSAAFEAWWFTLAPAKSGFVTDKWWQYEQLAARGGMAYGFTPRHVPTGPINADGIEPGECAFVDAKYANNPDSLKFDFRPQSPPEKLEELIDQLRDYHNAVITSNGVANAQPRRLIIWTNSLSSVPYYQSAMISAGFSTQNSRAEWMPYE